MSCQRGNVVRTRPQRHQNAQAFRNDRHDASARRKKINAKIHEGLCQHCKEVLEWRVKFNKYKPLTQPKKWIQTSLENTEHEPSKNDQTRNRNVEFEESHELDLSGEEDEDLDLLVKKIINLKPERT
ncbi:uncharacterized protein C9orf85 homolog isoform X2 [Podarcis muralis]